MIGRDLEYLKCNRGSMIVIIKMKFILWLIFVSTSNGMNYQFSKKLYDVVLSNYTSHLKPRDLNVNVVDVNIDLSIFAIINYDEKAGVLTFQGRFTLKWWDEMIMWDKKDHGSIDMIQLSIHDVWIPKVVIGNSVGYHSIYKLDNYFDSKLIYVTYSNNGQATISSSGVWETTCNSDVTKFPFDHHECQIQLDSIESSKDVNLMTSLQGASINYTSMHSEFKIKHTWIDSDSHNSDITWSALTFVLQLRREPTFMVMNLVVPIYIIGLSNLLVFLLPLDSSDRIAFALTMMLTFTVFMTMVTDQLPATDSLSQFNTFLLFQLIFSTIITVCVMILHYLYHKEEDKPIPKWVKYISAHGSNNEKKIQPFEKKGSFESNSTWKRFTLMLNKFLLGLFCVTIFCELIVFFCIAASGD